MFTLRSVLCVLGLFLAVDTIGAVEVDRTFRVKGASEGNEFHFQTPIVSLTITQDENGNQIAHSSPVPVPAPASFISLRSPAEIHSAFDGIVESMVHNTLNALHGNTDDHVDGADGADRPEPFFAPLRPSASHPLSADHFSPFHNPIDSLFSRVFGHASPFERPHEVPTARFERPSFRHMFHRLRRMMRKMQQRLQADMNNDNDSAEQVVVVTITNEPEQQEQTEQSQQQHPDSSVPSSSFSRSSPPDALSRPSHACRLDALKLCSEHLGSPLEVMSCLQSHSSELSSGCVAATEHCPVFNCARDALKFCSGVQRNEVVKCLKKHATQLSPQCVHSAAAVKKTATPSKGDQASASATIPIMPASPRSTPEYVSVDSRVREVTGEKIAAADVANLLEQNMEQEQHQTIQHKKKVVYGIVAGCLLGALSIAAFVYWLHRRATALPKASIQLAAPTNAARTVNIATKLPTQTLAEPLLDEEYVQ